MAELVTSDSRSLVVSALDEHTDLDALLGAILADSASEGPTGPGPGSLDFHEVRSASQHPAERVVVTAVASSASSVVVEPMPQSMGHVTVTVTGRPHPQVGALATTKSEARAQRAERAAMLTVDDLDQNLRHVELRPSSETVREPRLDEIDKFLDERIGRMTTPGWSTFAPDARAEHADMFGGGAASHSRLGAATRRLAAVAAAFGLGVLVVWTALH